MFDKIERTTRQGFFSRVAQSFMGVLIGFLLVPISIFLIAGTNIGPSIGLKA